MNGKSAPGNRHPVDELADIRETTKELKAREDELKFIISEMMGDADHLGGDEFIATQKISTRKGAIDQKAMEADAIDLAPYRKPDVTIFSIITERREVEAS